MENKKKWCEENFIIYATNIAYIYIYIYNCRFFLFQTKHRIYLYNLVILKRNKYSNCRIWQANNINTREKTVSTNIFSIDYAHCNMIQY